MQKDKFNIVNLGCRLNIYEGEVIKSLVSKSKLDNFTIINSCAVTQKAEKKVYYEINALYCPNLLCFPRGHL